MEAVKTDYAMRAWTNYFEQINRADEQCWKVRIMAFGFWLLTIGFAYLIDVKTLLSFSILTVLFFFLIEKSIRQVQEKYMTNCQSIETYMNNSLSGNDLVLSEMDCLKSYTIPSTIKFSSLFDLKNWGFLFPYLILLIITMFLLTL